MDDMVGKVWTAGWRSADLSGAICMGGTGTGEMRQGLWAEIDFTEAIWTVPASRQLNIAEDWVGIGDQGLQPLRRVLWVLEARLAASVNLLSRLGEGRHIAFLLPPGCEWIAVVTRDRAHGRGLDTSAGK